MTPRPHMVGIAGGSCSGKTTIARELAQHPRLGDVAHITLDAYYHNVTLSSPHDVEHYNFDDPQALDAKLLFSQIRALSEGRAIDKPVYDMTTHSRRRRTECIEPLDFMIIEGLYTLYWDQLLPFLHTKVFVDAEPAVCLVRRIERDQEERGRSREEVENRWARHVMPMFDAHVLPTKPHADALVSGTKPVERSVEIIIQHIDRIGTGK